MPFEDKNPVVIGSELLIQNDNGDAVASIDSTGIASFQGLTVVNSPEFYGLDLQTEIIAPLPRGIVASGSNTTYTTAPGGFTTEVGLLEIAFSITDTERNYHISGSFQASAGNSDNNIGVNVRYETAAIGVTPAKPTITSSFLFQEVHPLPTIGFGETMKCDQSIDLPIGNYRFLLSAIRANGTGLCQASGSTFSPIRLEVVDYGPKLPNIGVLNSGAGGVTAPVQQYTASWGAAWTASYKSNNLPGSFGAGDALYQGYNDSSNGNRRSMMQFDWAAIQSFLSGSTVTGCYIRLYFQHWYNNSGGTAIIGTHNFAGMTPAGSWSGGANLVASGGWPKPGLRTVNLGAGIGDLFRVGAAKGLSLGPGSDSSHTYYGYAAGASASADLQPRITFYYTK